MVWHLFAITPITDRKRPTYFGRLLHVPWKSMPGHSSCKIRPLSDLRSWRQKRLLLRTVRYNFSFFVFKAIFYRNKHMPKKQLEYLEGSQYLGWRSGVAGGGAKLGTDRITEGHKGGAQCISKLLGEGVLAIASHPTPCLCLCFIFR